MITLAGLRNGLEAGLPLSDVVARLDEAVSATVPPLRLAGVAAPLQAAA